MKKSFITAGPGRQTPLPGEQDTSLHHAKKAAEDAAEGTVKGKFRNNFSLPVNYR